MLSRLTAFLLVSLTLPRVAIAQWDPGFSSPVPLTCTYVFLTIAWCVVGTAAGALAALRIT